MATLFFVREEGFSGVSDFILLNVQCDADLEADDILDSMKRAFNEWMESTDAGRDAWINSSEDFNIGDFLHVSDDEDLKACLAEEGLVLEIVNSGNNATLAYDLVLAAPDISDEYDPDADD